MNNANDITRSGYYIEAVYPIEGQGQTWQKRKICIIDNPEAEFPERIVITLPKTRNRDLSAAVNEHDIGKKVNVTLYFRTGKPFRNAKLGCDIRITEVYCKYIDGNGLGKTHDKPAPEYVYPEQVAKPMFTADVDDFPF